MNRYWILVADAGKARIFAKPKSGEKMQLLEDIEHTASRQKNQDLASDRPGHYQSKGSGHGSMVEATDPKDHQSELFAKELVDKLEKGIQNQQYKNLLLVAPAKFWGLINKKLPKPVADALFVVEEKDLTNLSEHELEPMVDELIRNNIAQII